MTPLFLSIGLSADAFTVSVTDGMCSRKVNKKNALATSLTFGTFQGIMPLLGYYLGNAFYDVICRYQHWVALILLGAVGINMIVDCIREAINSEIDCETTNVFTAKNLIFQGVATSIDAMAAGISLIVLDIPIIPTSILIGATTFLVCYIGVFLGNKFGAILGQKAQLIGGMILILLALKIFFEHF